MTISELVSSFCPLVDKNEIQSEEEVRSKFIVPLLEIMGYPMELRAEEFPVYGSEGSKPLKTKKADYILFSDCDFASHRSNTNDNLKWVYEHSLLVFEAKKPSEELSIFHQPQFYAVWTRAVAYMISNGKKLVGYFLNPSGIVYQQANNREKNRRISFILNFGILRYFFSCVILLLKEGCGVFVVDI